eukprot:scaffold34543_cov63-Phaeocystis_antarctica.AAC.6
MRDHRRNGTRHQAAAPPILLLLGESCAAAVVRVPVVPVSVHPTEGWPPLALHQSTMSPCAQARRSVARDGARSP